MTAGTSLASKLGFDPPIAAEDYFQERTRRMRFPFPIASISIDII
jgi:hypothetical protein